MPNPSGIVSTGKSNDRSVATLAVLTPKLDEFENSILSSLRIRLTVRSRFGFCALFGRKFESDSPPHFVLLPLFHIHHDLPCNTHIFQ